VKLTLAFDLLMAVQSLIVEINKLFNIAKGAIHHQSKYGLKKAKAKFKFQIIIVALRGCFYYIHNKKNNLISITQLLTSAEVSFC
jgi:hypothetical protein